MSGGRGPLRGRARQWSRLMQLAILAVLVSGIAGRNPSVVVNAAVALAVTFLPGVLARDYRITLSPGLTLWLSAAVLLHAVGMLGPYHTVWWWDHLTHTLSGTIVAATGYTVARAIDIHSDAIYLPPRFMAVYILLFTMAFGVGWEVLEFVARGVADALGHAPLLVQFSLEDTVMDLVFDTVGAVLVAAFGTPRLSAVVRSVAARLEAS